MQLPADWGQVMCTCLLMGLLEETVESAGLPTVRSYALLRREGFLAGGGEAGPLSVSLSPSPSLRTYSKLQSWSVLLPALL